ncbi:hypothetical protein V6N11_019107 [Hibiscus sabdariffa]|uniref:Uncharacterized protein n=1 Tax=Hibiscus sabdariffa TaxID=183260 RepID=A0ABR2R1N2_9ROSI
MDPSRALQQSFCYGLKRNWSISVSWGYTVQLYPYIVTAKKLETAFSTFQSWKSWQNGPFTFNTRPVEEDPLLISWIMRRGSMGIGSGPDT